MAINPEKKSNNSFYQGLLIVIKRFGQDIFGLGLIIIGLISFLNSFNLTTGKLVDSWGDLIFKWFGSGSYLLFLYLIFVGMVILLRHVERIPKFNYRKLIQLEMLLFSFSALFSSFGGFSVKRANNGFDGGIIGWGIARIIRNIIGDLLIYPFLIIVTTILIINILGIHKKIEKYLDRIFTQVLSTDSPRFKDPVSPKEKTEDHTQSDLKGNNFTDEKRFISERSLVLPSTDLLLEKSTTLNDESFIHSKAVQIENTLEEFGVPARVAGYRVGPTIIQYAVEPGFIEKIDDDGGIVKKKVRVSQIASLHKDITLALSVERLRIEAPIPGHSFIGIEIPNINSSLVRLKTILESEEFKKQTSKLSLALGLDVSGNPIVTDLVKMPHLLVAGTTGSGKSVCITSLIACLAMNNNPSELRLAILDPKMVELVRFNGLPHLMGKVETQLDRMLAVLAWAINEMEDRYKKL